MAEPKVARWTLVYDELKRQIQSLELSPGAHLSESGIAQQFGVSASPVRDALGRLSQEGLLAVKRGQGYTVANLTIGNITEICDLRFVLETGAARLAMDRARPEDFDRLFVLSAATGEKHVADFELIKRNCEFHIALAGLSHNAKLVEAVRRVMDDSVRVFHLGLPAFASHGMQVDHDALINAIKDRDVETVTTLLHAEAYDASQRVLEQLLRNPDPRTAQLISMGN
ncbi:MAG: transcription regulator family protein [Glaciihabitans sp.]|nr:transcription regulator family protein [Glaciihabitans sp.]